MATNLTDDEIDDLWRRYRPLHGKDATADLILALIRKLVTELALAIPYGNWNDRLSHPLRKFGITRKEWEDTG
jgi:hypothetical protein